MSGHLVNDCCAHDITQNLNVMWNYECSKFNARFPHFT